MRWLAGTGLALVLVAGAAPAGAAVRFAPDHGPVGSVITVSGPVPAASSLGISRNAVLYLSGGGLLLTSHATTFSIDPRGTVRATFVVPSSGILSGRRHATVPGSYLASFPCATCAIGTFEITKRGKLPFSGAPILAFAVLALAALALGSGFVTLSPAEAPVRWRGTPRGRHAKGAPLRRPPG